MASIEMTTLAAPGSGGQPSSRRASYSDAVDGGSNTNTNTNHSGSASSASASSPQHSHASSGDSVALRLASDDDAPVTISFLDLAYTVDLPVKKLSFAEKMKGLSLRGFPKPEVREKTLLKNVSGVIRPGTLTSLMGPSGAGKSTLLDVLAGRKQSGRIEGELLFNGKPMTKELKRVIGYVEQTDTLLPTLTVRELLLYTARLKLPAAATDEQRRERVELVIAELGLQKCADTIIGNEVIRGISGGQAKRVNIGVELITDCRVLFLDEPTTGLDSATSFEVMSVVRHIADRGRSVICTIHQPSIDVFYLFNRLLLLVAGEVVYLGDIREAVSYFEKLGFKFVPGMNPADFVISVVGPGTGQNAKTIEGPEVSQTFFADQYKKSAMAEQRLLSAQTTGERVVEELKSEPVHFTNSAWHNLLVLVDRDWTQKRRDRGYLAARFVRIIFMDFILGTLFSNQTKDSTGVYNIVSILQFSVQLFAFGAMAFIGQTIADRPFFLRERNAATYQVSAYYWANVITDLPFTILQVLLWSCVLYWAVGLNATAGAFFTFNLFLLVIADTALALSQTFGAWFRDYQTASVALFPIVLLSFLFSGFYVRKPLIPVYLIWAYVASFLNYSLNGLAINQFSGPDEYSQTSSCFVCSPLSGTCGGFPRTVNSTVYCCVSSVTPSYTYANDDILATWGFGSESLNSNLWINFLALCCFWVFWRIMGYGATRYSKHGKQ